jgi:hypothetical protein
MLDAAERRTRETGEISHTDLWGQVEAKAET